MTAKAQIRNSLFGSKDQYAQTPPDILQKIADQFNNGKSMYDPCPVNPTKDGLEEETWGKGGCVYMNPPYKYARKWLKKAIEQVSNSHCSKVVALLPARTNTNWFHKHIFQNQHVHEMYFIKHGIKFLNYKKKAPFTLCIVVYKPEVREGSLHAKSIDFYSDE